MTRKADISCCVVTITVIMVILFDCLIKHNINTQNFGAVLSWIALYYSLLCYVVLGCGVWLLHFVVLLLCKFQMVKSWTYHFLCLMASGGTT
jgi:hypothetical protein